MLDRLEAADDTAELLSLLRERDGCGQDRLHSTDQFTERQDGPVPHQCGEVAGRHGHGLDRYDFIDIAQCAGPGRIDITALGHCAQS